LLWKNPSPIGLICAILNKILLGNPGVLFQVGISFQKRKIEPPPFFFIRCKKDDWVVFMSYLTYLDFLAKFGVGGAHPGGITLTKDILSSENISRNSYVLDAGCGTGQTAAYIHQKYKARVVGLEINTIMVEKAKKRFQTQQLPIPIIAGSVENIPFEDNTFDFILSESVLAFVQKPKALREFYRVLKKGGRLIANEMTINKRLSQMAESEIKKFYSLDSLLLEEDWRQLLEELGFQKIKIKKEKQSISHGNNSPEFDFSLHFEPELFDILNEHGKLVIKYHDVLSYRIFSCSKI
jgi:SAM-dependent methyltransferase